MNNEMLEKIIARGEYEKLDFKQEWYKDNSYNRQEIVKDILGLTNGNPNNIGESGFLIIGAKENLDGSIIFFDVELSKGIVEFKRELLQNINNYAHPKIIKLEIHEITHKEKRIIIIEIPQQSYLIELSKDLRPPNYRQFDVIYRIGESTERASSEVIEQFKKELEKFNQGIIVINKNLEILQREIKIDAHSILKLIISKRDFKKLSEDTGAEQNDGIFYKYYSYNDMNNVKGFMFLGNKITNKKVFFHFHETNKEKLPKKLEIFIAKQKKENGEYINKKRDILKLCKQYSLNIEEDNIHYIDDFIWENTIFNISPSSSHKRKDFIDQHLYYNEQSLGLSLEYFKKEINEQENSILVVTGSGGVGKTTFCDALQYTINQDNKIKKQVFYIKGEKIVKYFSENEKGINCLDDLYELYKYETDFNNLETNEFNLNYITGNIVVIVDAIEEIDSALNDKFNLEGFLLSLHQLNENFFSTKIILTTREHFLPKIKDIATNSEIGIKYFYLYGFTENNLNDFLDKRYNKDTKKVFSVNDFIESNHLFTKEKYIIPLFVDWVCKIIDRPAEKPDYNSEYFLLSHRLDKLLMILIKREISKQSLNITPDGMFKLLEEIIIHKNGSIALEQLKEYVELETNDDFTKYFKNPLFLQSRNTISIKYDILHTFVKTRFIRFSLFNRHITSDRIPHLLKECYQGKGEIYLVLVDLLKEDTNLETYTYYINNFKKKYEESSSSYEKETIKKAISGLLYLCLGSNNINDRNDATELLKNIYKSSGSISHLFIYGDFYPLDFSVLYLSNSYLTGYTNFYKSKFPIEDKTIFLYTRFKNIHIPRSNDIRKQFFDSSCEFIDCNIEEIANQSNFNENQKITKLKKDIQNLSGYMDVTKKSSNLVKRFCTITYPKGHKRLLDDLAGINFLVKLREQGNVLYQIDERFYDDLPSIVLGSFPNYLDESLKSLL